MKRITRFHPAGDRDAERWLDNAAWAEEFFAGPAVPAQLRDGAGGRVEGYRVTEAIRMDKR